MSLGWFSDITDAEDYFGTERLETDAWDDLDSAQKPKVINQAYNRLYYDPQWILPTYAEATAAQLVKLRIANAEMAYYLAVHLEGEDHRKGLQAQGTIEAGVVKEKYSEDMLTTVPVPPAVAALLDEFADAGPYIGAANIARDENEAVDAKVHEF